MCKMCGHATFHEYGCTEVVRMAAEVRIDAEERGGPVAEDYCQESAAMMRDMKFEQAAEHWELVGMMSGWIREERRGSV